MWDGDVPLRRGDDKTINNYLVGASSIATVRTYLEYAKSVAAEDDDGDDDNDGDSRTTIAVRILERAVSECPTVERLWTYYVELLSSSSDAALADVCHRAVRNCPYSVSLVKLRMRSAAAADPREIDADELLEIAKEATDARFLPTPEACLDVRTEPAWAVRRKLTDWLSVTNNDDNATKDLAERVGDAIEDAREAFDAADLFVRKNHHNWNAGRAKLWRERAAFEAWTV